MTRSQVYSSHTAVLQFVFCGFAVCILRFCGLHSAGFTVCILRVLQIAFCRFCSFTFFGRKRKISYKVLFFSMCTEKKNWLNIDIRLISGLRYQQRTKARYNYSELFCFAFDFSDFESKDRTNGQFVTASHIFLFSYESAISFTPKTNHGIFLFRPFKFWAGLQKVLSARHT